jgi:hypothetical protein
MIKDEALQMCLEYIETDAHERRHVRWAIKEALAADIEPVNYEKLAALGWQSIECQFCGSAYAQAFPQREWIGLTPSEIEAVLRQWDYEAGKGGGLKKLVAITETKLKEKNNG